MKSSESPTQFVQLLARNERGIYAFIVSLVPNWADADDILQQTSVKLWENFDRYEPGTDFGAWARTIARFEVMTYRKQFARHPLPQFSDEFLDAIAAKVEETANNDALDRRREALAECMKKLDKKTQAMLNDYYAINGPNLLAKKLGRTIDSLRVTIFRVRRTLYGCIERRLRPATGS